jgi:hypothetical protein
MNKKGNMIIYGIGILLVVAALVYGVIYITTKVSISNTPNPCIEAAMGTKDNCCVTNGLGNKYDSGLQECITITPPAGNPTNLELVRVTDSNNNVITPPTGQDALIEPVVGNVVEYVDHSNETNQT